MIELASKDTALVASIATSFSPVLHRAAATTSVSYVVRVEADACVPQALAESTRGQARTVPNVMRQTTNSPGDRGPNPRVSAKEANRLGKCGWAGSPAALTFSGTGGAETWRAARAR